MDLRPVEATYHGLHDHDHRLPDGSRAAVEAELTLLSGFESELAGHTEGELDTEVARYYVGLARFQAVQQGALVWLWVGVAVLFVAGMTIFVASHFAK